MDEIYLVQLIGNEVCEGCGPDEDCGIEPKDCDRIQNAIVYLNDFVNTQFKKGE